MSSDMDAQLKNLQGQLQVERQCAVNERRLREQAESRTKQERHHAEQERKFMEEHRKQYVQLMIEYRLTGSVREQLEHFIKGFHDIVPPELVSIFDEQELALLISGQTC